MSADPVPLSARTAIPLEVLTALKTVLPFVVFEIIVWLAATFPAPSTTSPSTPARTGLDLPMAEATDAPMPPTAPASSARREGALDSV